MNEEQVRQLHDLVDKHPEIWREVAREHPDWVQQIQDEAKVIELVGRTKEDSPDGFFAFYEGIHGIVPPPHVKRWIETIYRAHGQGLGFTLNGYRGSWKSVSISADFTAWRIGKEPGKTNLIVSANDDNTDKITKRIAQTIEFHPFWKRAFPNVVPDSGRWSTDGYWVIDTSMQREQWAEQQSGVIDPTLIGGGYKSTRINGKHPTGVLITDDLHGINNSTSETERNFVVLFVTSELSKTVVRMDDKLDSWVINIGVPWGQNDVHQVLSKSGGYLSETHPVMYRAKENEEGAVYIDGVNEQTGVVFEDIKGWWKLSWPEKFGVQTIKHERGIAKFGFWQMMMMDLSQAKAGGIRYYVFPHSDIDKVWPCVSGVDPSYTFRERSEFDRKSSSFAVGNVLKRPRGGAVLQGGVLEQCNTNTAAGYLASIKSQFINHLYFAVENVGIGRLFIEVLRKINPSLIIVFSDLGGIRAKGVAAGKAKDKSTRTRTELAPHLENATILISDEETEYLNAIRSALDDFSELDPGKPDKRWDAIDSFYHAVKAMPDVLQQKPIGDEIPSLFKKKESAHPLMGRTPYG